MAPTARRGPSASRGGGGAGRKKPWTTQEPRLARGSVREGQGFAFWRKQKIQRDYKKLLEKQRHAVAPKTVAYTENYPEHLKHLYLAEEEMLKKQRKPKNNTPVTVEGSSITTPKSNIKSKKTSNQKAKEEYEKIKAQRDRKKEAARKRREEREKAQKLYKQKKIEAYKILSKRTRKGQPNLNVQIDYLLQKIQQKP